MYLLDILNYHVFKRHLFSTGWFENKLQKREVSVRYSNSRAGQMMFNTQFLSKFKGALWGKKKKKNQQQKSCSDFWVLLNMKLSTGVDVVVGRMFSELDTTTKDCCDSLFHEQTNVYSSSLIWLFLVTFVINLSNFYLFIQSDSPFYYTYICFHECMNLLFWVSIFCSELWPRLSWLFFILSLITVIFILVFVQKKDLFETL